MVHRIANGPVQEAEHLRWPLERILAAVEEGLRKAAVAAPEGIRSISIDGWAVDYVRLGRNGAPIYPPYCYRDERTVPSKAAIDLLVSPQEFFAQTGAQPQRINTVYQLAADAQAGVDPLIPWLNLPEFAMHWLGGRRVSEYTNATHTGLVDIRTGNWSRSIFARLGLAIEAAPEIVFAGTFLGKLRSDLATLPALADADLIAPACHDTASAIAAIADDLDHTAYIVSGTWSLVGTVVDRPVISPEAERAGFTNQGAATGGYCFHANVNGMWLLRQCLDHWAGEGRGIELPTLIAKAQDVIRIPSTIDVDAPPLMLAGEMPARINRQLLQSGHNAIPDIAGNEPVFARVIFASLAKRYAGVLRDLELLTGRQFQKIIILGGGSRNTLLSRLTQESSGRTVFAGEVEGSTLGNFAVQLAAGDKADGPLPRHSVRAWASRLATRSPLET
jgi:rhamnulokinase